MRKQLVTLNVDNYCPAITEITFPAMEKWAAKIGAEFNQITRRVNLPHPQFDQNSHVSVTYQKFQLYEMAADYDWTIFLDADALVHPDTPDWTESVTKDIVVFHGLDMSLNRFRANNYTRRSKMLMGACTWCVIFSDWCRDVWHPMQETTWDECMENIYPTIMEDNSGVCRREHLIDDYLVTQNIARYGLKTQTIAQLCQQFNQPPIYFHHLYACSEEFKIKTLKERAEEWAKTPTLQQRIEEEKAKEDAKKTEVSNG